MYAQTVIKGNIISRNGAYGIVNMDVQKCTRGVHRYGARNTLLMAVSL